MWDDEAGKYALWDLAGEHGPYFVYESRESGAMRLVPKGEVWRFADDTPCKTQIPP